MKADSPLVAEVAASPNHGERRGRDAPDMLILHYTGMETGAAALDRLRDLASEVSCHYFVGEDGRIVQLVPERRRAWHAGASRWGGASDINSRSIGIEIVNPGHAYGYRPFPGKQIAAVIELCRECVDRWRIPAANVLGHSDIAPLRKEDPGELFPWDQLFQSGVGHYVPPARLGDHPESTSLDAPETIEAVQRELASYGYDLDPTGIMDDRTVAVTIAFQRHFRPERIDGLLDLSTTATLRHLLRSRPNGAIRGYKTDRQASSSIV